MLSKTFLDAYNKLLNYKIFEYPKKLWIILEIVGIQALWKWRTNLKKKLPIVLKENGGGSNLIATSMSSCI